MNYKKILYPHKKSILYFCIALVTLISFNVYADNENVDAQIELLEKRISQTQDEYKQISQQKNNAQLHCNIVNEIEKQMTSMNQMNNARRAQIRLLNNKKDFLVKAQQN